ncbi:MAG: UvrB/UvrC motif-containing protein, partial [Prevotella sp.]|nr:UvrB/UvrC motif-containing protein [Prevotella sp.]
VGVNLLREGLDLPEVSLVAILDADKEGFLRSHRSLTQTVGRAARNVNGRVIFYADKITDSMQKTINETNRRREVQIAYNEEHGIKPQQIQKARNSVFNQRKEDEVASAKAYNQNTSLAIASEDQIQYMSKDELKKAIAKVKKQMTDAAKKLEFLEAAQYRDQMIRLEDELNGK